MFKKIVVLLSILIAVKTVSAQSDSLKIGGWRSYLPYQLSRSVTQSKDEIIIATEFSIMSIDKAENSFSFKSKVEGLSDAGVQLVKYNKFSDILFIAYTNSNIDLVYKDGEIVNIRDIVDNINIVGDKTIYDVYIKDATFAYIACGFGVLKMNMKKGEFDFTTFTNSKVRGVAVWNNNLYIATEKGVFSIEDNNSLNPADFNLWKILGKKAIADSAYNARVVASYQDKLYFDANDTLFSYDGNAFKKIFYSKNDYISCLTTEGKKMLIGVWRTQSDGGTWGGRLFYLNENLTLGEVPNSNDCIVDLNYAIEDENGQIWLADVERGVKVFSSINGGCRYISTNSPFSHTMQQLKLEDNNIWIASGGFTTNNSYNGNPDGFYHYIDGKWGFKNRSNDPIMKDGYLYNIHTVTSVAVNKDAKRRFIGSFWGGLLELDEKGNIIKHYTAKNSSLQTAIGDANSTRVGGIAFDKNGTLWVSNNSATRPLSALTSDGKWHSMASDFANAQVYQIAVDPNTGYKWMAIGKGNASIIVYDEGKNIDDESDDRSIVLNSTNTLLPGSKVNWMESDLDGKMWVATDDGVIWFSCGSSIFDKATKSGICNGSLPTTIVDGIPEYLLKYNNVNTIAVDGANRKWFGTSNGIFVQSADGKSQIAYFDKANSPLFDNNIIDIEINDNTGEIFIATNKGLQSIKGEALLGSDIHYDVTVYPNPVRPEYEGLIAIKGLAEDANVKITDINGALVYETTALGGQAVWDGRDYKGRTVQKGVYLIFSAFTKDVEYPDEAVAKVLIMK
jgi:ligand-binding sensor domain-containing protein